MSDVENVQELSNPYDSLNTLWRADDSGENATAAGKKMRKGLIATVKEVRYAIDAHSSLVEKLWASHQKTRVTEKKSRSDREKSLADSDGAGNSARLHPHAHRRHVCAQ